MKRLFTIISAVLLLFSLFSGCGSQVQEGEFDVSHVSPADTTPEIKTTPVSYSDSFRSTDNTVSYNINIDTVLTEIRGTVLKVTPHYLTDEDAKRAAHALLGERDYYEDTTMKYLTDESKRFTRAEVEGMLAQWEVWKTEEWLQDFYGSAVDNATIQTQKELVERFIQSYTAKLNQFPEELIRIPCEFQFHDDWFYSDIDATMFPGEVPNREIRAETEINGIRYVFVASSRDEDDFKLNNIHAYISTKTGPGLIPEFVWRRSLTAADAPPTQEQLDAVQAKVEQMLKDMQLGEWYIQECYYADESVGDHQYYRIHVNALPVLHGIHAADQPQPGNLKETGPYASNYYMTAAEFVMSPYGDLLNCTIYSPLDITQVVADHSKTMSYEELFEIAKTKFSEDTAGNHWPMGTHDPEVECRVNITDIDYKISRTKVPGTDDSYYYAPALSFIGTHNLYIVETGEPFFINEQVMNENGPRVFLTLNAVDGSVIYE